MNVYVRIDVPSDLDRVAMVEGVYPTMESALVAAGDGPGVLFELDGRLTWSRSSRYETTLIQEFTVAPTALEAAA